VAQVLQVQIQIHFSLFSNKEQQVVVVVEQTLEA